MPEDIIYKLKGLQSIANAMSVDGASGEPEAWFLVSNRIGEIINDIEEEGARH